MMYDKLIKRLRNAAQWADKGLVITPSICLEAADAIEELLASCDNFEAALKDSVEEYAKHLWIPVTERLPEEDGRYLTLYPLKTKPRIWRHKVYGFAKDLVEVDEYDFNEHKSGFYGYDGEYGYYEDKDVTHWMPLPEPPKEET